MSFRICKITEIENASKFGVRNRRCLPLFCARRASGTFPPSADGETPQPGKGVSLTRLGCTGKRLPRKGLPPSYGVSLRNSVAPDKGCRKTGLPPGSPPLHDLMRSAARIELLPDGGKHPLRHIEVAPDLHLVELERQVGRIPGFNV